MAKNSASPVITSQPMEMSRPCTYPTRTWSISATPPPAAVELTFQMVRPASTCRTWPAARANSAYRRVPMTGSSRDTDSRGTSTACNRLTGAGLRRTVAESGSGSGDFDQAVVLGDPLAAGRRARFQLPAPGADGQVRDERVLGFP